MVLLKERQRHGVEPDHGGDVCKMFRISGLNTFTCYASVLELILGHHVVADAHSDTELEEFAHMSHQLVETGQNGQLLAVVTPVEGNLWEGNKGIYSIF